MKQVAINNQYYLTRARFEQLKNAGQLVVGGEYYFTDDDFQLATIIGTSAPTTSTAGSVGQQYLDTTSAKMYVCTAVSGSTYTWNLVLPIEEYTAAEIDALWNA